MAVYWNDAQCAVNPLASAETEEYLGIFSGALWKQSYGGDLSIAWYIRGGHLDLAYISCRRPTTAAADRATSASKRRLRAKKGHNWQSLHARPARRLSSTLDGFRGWLIVGQRKVYDIEPIPAMRRFAFDSGYLGRRRHIVHGLIEVDVTDARNYIREHERNTGEKLSFTAFIVACLSKAIEKHPHVHAYRDWRNRLVIYRDINITCMFEVAFGSKKIPMPHVFREINHMSLRDVHEELRKVQNRPHRSEEARFMSWFLYLPAFLRRFFYWVVMKFPRIFRESSSPVMVTAVGMFGAGGGWAITMPNFTLNVGVGGISKKPGVHEGKIEIREFLDLTVSIDHDIVDGAPAARFVQTFRTLLENAEGLQGI